MAANLSKLASKKETGNVKKCWALTGISSIEQMSGHLLTKGYIKRPIFTLISPLKLTYKCLKGYIRWAIFGSC